MKHNLQYFSGEIPKVKSKNTSLEFTSKKNTLRFAGDRCWQKLTVCSFFPSRKSFGIFRSLYSYLNIWKREYEKFQEPMKCYQEHIKYIHEQISCDPADACTGSLSDFVRCMKKIKKSQNKFPVYVTIIRKSTPDILSVNVFTSASTGSSFKFVMPPV